MCCDVCEIAGRWSVVKIGASNPHSGMSAGKCRGRNTPSLPRILGPWLMNSSVTIRLPGFAVPAKDIQTPEATAGAPLLETAASDEALMDQICQGSREALAILFRRYARLVRTIAMRILRDDSEADDLLQEVFLFVHRNCSIFDSSKSGVRSWIVQMTYHRAIDRRRYLSSRHFYTRVDLDGVADLLDSRSESREDEAPFGSLVGNATVPGLLATLTEDQRNTLSLHFFDGYTFAEIAAQFDQSVGNIRNHYYRGLEKLRKQMFPAKLPSRNGYGRK
jgi:RNA polymerase sigma-70 factor, ECF subfamily